MDYNSFCHAQRTIRARKASSKSLTFIRSMRSTLASFQLAVTVFLAIVPFVSATPASGSFQPSRRDQPTILQTSVGPYRFLIGPYSVPPGAESLQVSVNGGPGNNTVENCVNACQLAGQLAAGVAEGTKCFCAGSGVLTSRSPSTGPIGLGALLACPGKPSEACGQDPNISIVYENLG